MQLVGGLNLRFFQRSPFYEYARLQLDSCRPDQAKAALQVISSDHDQWMHSSGKAATDSSDDHSCFESDSAFIEQYCNEIVQQGDLRLAEGKANAALEAYVSALKTLESHFRRRLQSTGLRTTRSRCYRKILHLKATHTDLSDPTAAEKLLAIMKKHEKASEHCENLVERVKCIHELGRVNILLLQSPAAQPFASIEQTVSLLEEAYALGNHLGLSDLNKQLRTSLGISYLLQLWEEECISKGEAASGDDARHFLSWASATLLSNSSIIERPEDCSRTADVPDLELDKCLEQLSARLSLKTRASPRVELGEMAASTKQQVRRLPSSWLIVTVAVSVTSELVISRIMVSCLNECLVRLAEGAHDANLMCDCPVERRQTSCDLLPARGSLEEHNGDHRGSHSSIQV